MWKHLFPSCVQHIHSLHPEISVFSSMWPISVKPVRYQTRCWNCHLMSTESMNTIDFHTGPFAPVSCGLWPFWRRNKLVMNNNSVFWRGVWMFLCGICLKEWVMVKSTVESGGNWSRLYSWERNKDYETWEREHWAMLEQCEIKVLIGLLSFCLRWSWALAWKNEMFVW